MTKHTWWLTGFVVLAVALTPAAPAEDRKGDEETRPAVKAEGREQPNREAPGERDIKREARGEGEVRREPRGEGEIRREVRGEGGREGMGGLPRELSQMIEELKLTDEQKKALQGKLREKETALDAWRKENDAKLRAAQDALRALLDEQRKVAASADANVMSVLTREQLATWETLKIVKLYDRRGENPLILTEAQLAKIKTLCEAAVKELLALPTTQSADAEAAKREILYKLQKKIYYDVLEEQDRAAAPNPDRGRPGVEGRAREGEGRGERKVEPRQPTVPRGEDR